VQELRDWARRLQAETLALWIAAAALAAFVAWRAVR